MQLLALVAMVVVALAPAYSSSWPAASAYQLTNNLIANNLPPRFVQSAASGAGGTTTNSEIVVRVKEGPQSIGKLIYSLKGEDPDEDPLTFGVLGTMASDLLRIENLPGNQANVYLRKELDRETTESHQVVITLTDGKLGRGNWITKSMLIIVEDVNDNYPVFAPHRTAISVREDAKAPLLIETIEATDADEGRFGQVIYKLDESSLLAPSSAAAGQTQDQTPQAAGQLADIFQIETIGGKGVLSLVGQLDFEQRPLYQLRVLAIDRAHENERLSTSTSILISVEDCEDQPPMFTFAPSITRIPEDLAVGSPVLRVSAIDGDRGVNNPIKYSLVSVNGQESGSERNLFSIGSDSGQISVAHPLDRELSLNPSSSSSGAGAGRSTNQPGAYVLQVRASEVASGSSGLLDSLFGPSAAAAVAAATSVTTELTVILVDVNDELPTFSQAKFYGELLENSPAESLVSLLASAPSAGSATREVAAAKVVDRDQGTNGTFTLHLEGEHGHLFEVWPSEATNEANLMIKVSGTALQLAQNAKYLDYERTRELRLAIVAREKFPPLAAQDGGPAAARQTRAEMTIQLRDANDNYPQFDSDLYRVEIPENAIRGMHICAVKAWDADSGPLGSAGVRYTEIRGERASMFKLDQTTGVITLKTNEHGFDRETISQHHLIVEARDNLGLGNRNTTQLLIVLTDVNDQRPKFLLDQYEAFIYENELDFQSPLQVQAQDQDAAHTPNSRLTYSIVAGDPQQNFTIDPQTGRIRVRATLVARDSAARGDLQAGGETAAGEPPGPNFVQVAGLDFERIAQKRDDTRQFNLTVKATDGGLPEPLADTTQVIVFVYDKNDHAPVFSRPVYSKSVREDAPGGSPVLQVQAQDGDHSPANSRISYRISSGGGGDKFVIDSDSGLISIANGANLDIDRVQGGGARRTSYLLNVLASDGSFGLNQKSSSCLVNISIIDVNNKAPEFVSLGASLGAASSSAPTQLARHSAALAGALPAAAANQHWVLVNEDAPYGLIVTRVFATDLDSTAELRYSINYARSEARNEDMQLVEPQLYRDVFTIEPTDGTIKVSKQLDRELFDQVKLRLQVEDLAAQTADQLAHAHLLVRITDVNDNRPTFKRPVYKAVVYENSIGGTSVITMTADDRDLNKTLRYSLEAPAPEVARLVRINPRSGEVTVNDKIDRELFPLINVTIRAEDFGQPHPLTGSAQLVISVRDENDNNPIFINSTHLRPPAVGPSDQSAGPAPPNHNMNYLSESGGGGASTYRLRSLGPGTPAASGRFLNEDQPPILDLTEEQPHDRSHHQSQLAPADDQGRELSLLAPGATALVREDAPVGRQIAYVKAEDADVGNNGRVTYLLDSNSSGGGKFRIDRDSGILSVAQPLDREQQRHFALIIEACDNFDLGYSTGESRRAFTQVNIQVTDINDNAPQISTNLRSSQAATAAAAAAPAAQGYAALQYPSHEEAANSQGPYEMPLAECLFINEFQPPNEPILTITATDLDDPETPNGQVDLAIINNQPQQELFALVPVRSPNPPLGAAASGSNLGNEPVTLTTSTSSSRPLAVVAGPASDLNHGFGDQLDLAPGPVGPGRSRRSLQEALSSGPLEPSGSLRSAAGARLGRGPSALLSTTEPPPTSSVTVPTLASVSAAAAGSFQLQQGARGGGLLRSGVQTIAGGEHQMHVVVSQSLKERVGNYTILVRATDRGLPALSSAKLINICVQDVNNHEPLFVRPPLNHTIRVMENATIGSYVTQVEATDLDHGLNGELQYSLKPTNNIQSGGSSADWQAFKIDRLSGVISTTKLFNRQLKKYYSLRVQAQDFGRPTSLSSDIDLNIMIVNMGKYQPEFERQQQQLQFTENLAPGTEWFKLPQTVNLDDDPALINAPQDGAPPVTGPRNQGPAASGPPAANLWLASPCYYIVDGDDHEQVFHLDRYTHKLTNHKELDREKKANYTLIVQASNNCNSKPVGTTPMRLLSADELAAGSSPAADRVQSQRPRAKRQTIGVSRPQPPPPRTGKRIYDDQAPSQSAAAQELQLSPNWDQVLADDKSLLKLSIRIKDVNDNAPKFTQRTYTGGITTEADFGTVFMIVQALDADADSNGQVAYSIVKPIKRYLSLQGAQTPLAPAQVAAPARQKRQSLQLAEAVEPSSSSDTKPRYVATSEPTAEQDPPPPTSQPSGANELGPQLAEGDDLFVIGQQTGEISLNFDPQRHMKGYFEFQIQARDPEGLSDSARVLIYLLRQDQRVKFVLRLTPQELRQRLNKFRSVFGNITGAIVNIDSYKYFENHDGTVDKKRTSLFLHFVQPEDNSIIEVDKVLTLIDNNIEYLDELYKEFHVLSSEAAHLPLGGSGALVDPIDQVRTGLMGVSSFLALILVLVIALCLNQRTRYERQLKAATVTAFGTGPLHLDPDFHSTTNLPNTNLHSQDPNPIWINGHHYGAGACHWQANESQNLELTKSKRPDSGQGPGDSKQAKKAKQQLFHSASSGLGMALDGDDDDDELAELDDQLSSNNGDQSSDLNSLHNQHHQHHLNHYNAASAATATPRDSLASSHGQVSSSSAASSGANSASTTNERQGLCSARQQTSSAAAQSQKPPAAGQTTKLKLGPAGKPTGTMQSGGANSTFGHGNAATAFKEVTIYTEHQQNQRPVAPQAPAGQQQHQTSHVNRLASQFNASRLQLDVKSSVYALSAGQQDNRKQPRAQQQRGHLLVHSNGAEVSQGIIKTTGIQSATSKQFAASQQLDAKFVPANQNQQQTGGRLAQNVAFQQQQEQSVNNFESSLSKLSILNLETTEL